MRNRKNGRRSGLHRHDKKEIDTSWKKSKTGATQKEFPQEMAKRTVINRAAKTFINTSNDDDHLTNAINETTSNEYDNEREVKQAEPAQVQKLEEKIKQNAPQEEAEEPNQEKEKHSQNKPNQLMLLNTTKKQKKTLGLNKKLCSKHRISKEKKG